MMAARRAWSFCRSIARRCAATTEALSVELLTDMRMMSNARHTERGVHRRTHARMKTAEMHRYG